MAKGDPRKPKGKMSAYAYFIKTCRQEHEKKTPEVPVNFTMFSKKCSERWKTISSKEKGKFEDLAKQDKVRFDNEMQHFAPGRKKGQKKDPNAPKRPPSGFFIFCADHRPKIKAVHPTLGIGDVAKKLGEQWNNLTDANKQPYLQKANKLKDKYQKDVADYKSKGKVGGGASLVQQQQTQQQQHTMTNNDDDEDEDEDDDEDDDDDDE
ncbi:high mobility group protein B3a [Gadus morhua]|uniref:HMG box domain-containing protein n=1 Tax=Gadus morhua TaxID=8049 RepID=A0A8C5CHB0_GADMO|nr:high mobility group protein B3 [Gadus morhua]XP_056431579.1 high mobility group protein B3a [Gadus chalcogrammus]